MIRRITTVHRLQARTAPADATAEAALSATDWKESTAVSINPIDPPHADTWEGRQGTAAIAIAHACEHGLPKINHWIIDRDQEVRGMVHTTDGWLLALKQWAQFLAPAGRGAPRPLVRKRKGSTTKTVEVSGAYRGVRFVIYATPLADEIKQLYAEAAAS